MRIGKLEIRWTNPVEVPGSKVTEDMSFVFAVPEDHAWVKAVHQMIDGVEQETIDMARKCSANPSLVNYHTGAGEGVAMVRMRFIEKRERAIQTQRDLNRQRTG